MGGLYRVRRKIRPGRLASQSHGMGREDRAMSGPTGKSSFQGKRGGLGQRQRKEESGPFLIMLPSSLAL